MIPIIINNNKSNKFEKNINKNKNKFANRNKKKIV